MRVPQLGPGRAAAVVVAGAAMACLAAALAQPPVPVVPTASVIPIDTTVLVCPRPTTGPVTGSTLSLLAPVVDGASPDTVGRATLSAMTDDPDPVVDLTTSGTTGAVTLARTEQTVPFLARGVGLLAPALVAGQVTRVTAGRTRGLSATACTAPTGDSWFVGGGGDVGRRTTVLLTNPDSTPALVDLEVFGPSGPVEARGGVGVLVAPRSQRAVRLDVLVPGTTRTAVHVVARAGRVSAAMQDVDTLGLIPRGADYVPLSAAPATRVVLPGVLGGTNGTRVLNVVAPGEADAIVDVRLVADDGTFAPESSALLEIPAGAVAQVDLSPFLEGISAAGVLLESDVPVVAGVRTVVSDGAGGAEVAYTAGTVALSGPAGFAPVTVDDTRKASVFLTASGDDGAVTLTLLDPRGGSPTSRDLLVPAGTTLRVDLTDPLSGVGVVLTPAAASGPVTAALMLSESLSDGLLRSSVPLVTGATTITVPPVRPDPATGVPGH